MPYFPRESIKIANFANIFLNSLDTRFTAGSSSFSQASIRFISLILSFKLKTCSTISPAERGLGAVQKP